MDEQGQKSYGNLYKDMMHTFYQRILVMMVIQRKQQNEVVGKNTSIKRGRIHLVKREQKQQFAMDGDKPCVLIDDYIKNIKEWEAQEQESVCITPMLIRVLTN